MGVVHQQPGPRRLGDGRQFRQGRQVAVHAEDAIGGDEGYRVTLGGEVGGACTPGVTVQLATQRPQIPMGIAAQSGPCQQGPVDEGGMIELVLQH